LNEAAHVDETWPASEDLDLLRRRMAQSIEQIGRGRHAAGDRTLRQVICSLARRRDWQHAIEGALTLAAALLNRGRPKEARALLNDAKQYASAASRVDVFVDVAVLAAAASIDMGRLDEGEAMLHASLAAARSRGDA